MSRNNDHRVLMIPILKFKFCGAGNRIVVMKICLIQISIMQVRQLNMILNGIH